MSRALIGVLLLSIFTSTALLGMANGMQLCLHHAGGAHLVSGSIPVACCHSLASHHTPAGDAYATPECAQCADITLEGIGVALARQIAPSSKAKVLAAVAAAIPGSHCVHRHLPTANEVADPRTDTNSTDFGALVKKSVVRLL